MKEKVVVLGAGPAGISAGWKLAQKGYDVRVVEQEPYVGGLSHTIRRDGYLFDFGPHRFHTDNPAVLAEIKRLVGELPVRARRTRVYFRGHYYDYPLAASNLFASLSPGLALLCFGDFLSTWLRNKVHPVADDSFKGWVVNRFGRRLYDVYFGPYTAKVWGRDPSRLSASWAAQRVAVVNLWDLLLRVLQLRRGYNRFHHSPYKLDFFYPTTGVGHIYDRMAEETTRHGGTVSLATSVHEILCLDGRVSEVVVEHAGARERIEADYVVSTLPISATIMALRPRPPEDVLAAARAISFRAMIFLFLAVDGESVTDDHWIYFPDTDLIFNRISEMKNFTPDGAPAGKTSLTLEISCDVGDEIWEMSEQELYRRCMEGLEKVGLIRPGQALHHFFARSLHAYPTYDLRFEANLGRLAYHLAGLRNLVVCGRQGLFRYINQDHAIEMGFCAAEEIATRQIGTRVSRVGAERVYFG